MSNKDRGLYPKYEVRKIVHFKNQRNEDVTSSLPVNDWVFVLNPSTDPGARVALRAYANWCFDNGYHQLGDDIEDVLDT